MDDDQMGSWPTQVTLQGQQSIDVHDEALLLTGCGTRTRRLSTDVHDYRCCLHYGKVTSETARKVQMTVEGCASLSVGQRASGGRDVSIPILPRPRVAIWGRCPSTFRTLATMPVRPRPRLRARAKDRSMDRTPLSLRCDPERYPTFLWPSAMYNHSCIRQELACYTPSTSHACSRQNCVLGMFTSHLTK